MSRCFPFPPPGYEKKARTNDVDVLIKEKQREKKHKKEKKDKEKREGKGKKEKDRTDSKHREKKERKEKQRDKTKVKEKDKYKEKDKDKDKDKGSTSGEKKFKVQTEAQHEEKFNQKGQDKKKDKSSSSDEKRFSAHFVGYNGLNHNGHRAEERKNLKFVQELGRRIREEDSGIGHQMAEKFTDTDWKGDEAGERLNKNSRLTEAQESTFVQELEKRIEDQAAGTGSQVAEKLCSPDRKKDEGVVTLVAMEISSYSDGKEKKQGDDRKLEAQGGKGEAKYGGNTLVQNLPGLVHGRIEGVPKLLDGKIEQTFEGPEKTKQKENDSKLVDKRKDKDREKETKSQGKEKSREKEKKREEKEKKREEKEKKKEEKEKKKKEKAKERSEPKNTEPDKKASNQADHLVSLLDLHEDSNNIVASDEVLKKRKVLETNGFLHATSAKPNKLSRPSLSHTLTENGRVLEPCQTPIKLTPDSTGAANNLKVDTKMREDNGKVDASSVPISSAKQQPSTVQANQISVAPSRPPHPDTKYLSRILSVPKVEEWLDFDDQEWLFSGEEARSKKPEMEPCLSAEAPQVWSEALRIDTSDICALPYVIPY